jgi:hypothetical protein
MQKYNLQKKKKNPLEKKPKSFKTLYNSVTKSQVSTQAKNIMFQKILILKKREKDLLLLLLLFIIIIIIT